MILFFFKRTYQKEHAKRRVPKIQKRTRQKACSYNLKKHQKKGLWAFSQLPIFCSYSLLLPNKCL